MRMIYNIQTMNQTPKKPDSRFKSRSREQENPLIVIPKEKKDEIEQEIKQNIFQIPSEDVLQEELEEVEKAKELEERWKEIRKQQELQEAQIKKKKLEKIEGEQKRLAERLEELVNEPEMDESEQKYKLIALKRRIEQDYKNDLKQLNEQFLLSREQDIEKIVRKKIEMERIIEKKKKMNEEFAKLNNELAIIGEVKNKKDMKSKQMLEKALKRLGEGNLGQNDFLSEEDKVLLAETLLDDKMQGEKAKQQILTEVQSKVNQQMNKNELETQNKIKNLNDLRFDIAEKQEKVLLEKAIHGEIAKKGVDYLTEIELGNAPPMEFIKKNIKIDEERLDQYRDNVEVKDIVRKGRNFLVETEERIKVLKISQKLGEIQEKPYNNEAKPFLLQAKPESVFIARRIVDNIIHKALRQILEQENKIQRLKDQRAEFEIKKIDSKKSQNRMIDRQFIDEMAEEIFTKVMRTTEKEAAVEVAKVNLIAQSIALNIIRTSVKNERNTSNTLQRVQELYFEFREGITKKETGHKFNFLAQDEIEWKKVKKGKKQYNQAQLEKQEKKKRRVEDEVQEEEKKEEQPDDDDLDVIFLDPKDCKTTLGLDKVKEYEQQYWDDILLQYKNFKEHSNSLKVSVTYLGLSPFQEFVVVGMSNGEINLYDTDSSPAVIAAIIPSSTRSPIKDVNFGLDNIGHVAVLEEQGILRFCYNAYNLKSNISKEALNGLEKLPEMFQPMFYMEYMQFSYKHLLIKKEEPTDSKAKSITFGAFHPSITFSCLQPYMYPSPSLITSLASSAARTAPSSSSTATKTSTPASPTSTPSTMSSTPKSSSTKTSPSKKTTKTSSEPKSTSPTPQARTSTSFASSSLPTKPRSSSSASSPSPRTSSPSTKKGTSSTGSTTTSTSNSGSGHSDPKSNTNSSWTPQATYRVVEYGQQFYPETNASGKSKQKQQQQILDQGTELYSRYFKEDNDYQTLLEKKDRNKQTKVIVCQGEVVQSEGQTQMFYTLTVNHEQERVVQGLEREFKVMNQSGQVAKVKSSLLSQYLYIEVIKPHQISEDLVSVEFVGLNTANFKLKKLRPEIECTAVEAVEFEVVDNYYPFRISYLFAAMPYGILVISLATGSILKVISEHVDIVRQTFVSKSYEANGIKVIENEGLFISYKNCNGVWKFDLQDHNDEAEKRIVYDQSSKEFETLFHQ